MLKACFGSGSDVPKDKPTANDIKSFARMSNAIQAAQEKKG